METKPVIDPQREEEKLHNRRNQFFARLAGVVAAIAGGITTGYHAVKHSLLARVRNQITMVDWGHHIDAQTSEFTGGEKNLFSVDHRVPDPAVKAAIHDLYTNNEPFIQSLNRKFGIRVHALKESRAVRFDEISRQFAQAAEKAESEYDGLHPEIPVAARIKTKSDINKEAQRIKKEFDAIREIKDPGAKHVLIQELLKSLKENFYPDSSMYAEKNVPLFNALRESGFKLYEKLSKEHNNFFNLVDNAKKELIDTPIFKELIKADNQPGHMGLGFRHADFKHKIFFKAGVAAVTMGAIGWGGVRLLQLFKDRSDLQEQRGYLKRELGRREATALDNFESHARA